MINSLGLGQRVYQHSIVELTVTKTLFISSALSDWFQLDAATRNSESIAIFKSRLLSFICPIQSDVYNIFDPIGLKFLTRLRLYFSHLNEH